MIPTVTTTYMALTGSELLAQVKILGEISEPELATATGYVTAEGKPKIAALRSNLRDGLCEEHEGLRDLIQKLTKKFRCDHLDVTALIQYLP